jgi:hypothetical protein
MTPECAKHYTDAMQRELGGTFDVVKLRELWPDMKNESDSAMEGAYDYIVKNWSTLPSPQKLLDAVQLEGRKLKLAAAKNNEEDWKKEKGNPRGQTFLSKEQQTEHGKRCRQIYDLACPVNDFGVPIKPNRERLIMLVELCEAMEKAYPAEAGSWKDLKMHFVRMNGQEG